MSQTLALASLLAGCLDTSGGSSTDVDEERRFGIDAFPTFQECLDAKERGDYHTLAPCQDQILLCPGGQAQTLIGGDVVTTPTYTIDGDTIVIGSDMTGTLAADGTLITGTRLWKPLRTSPPYEPGTPYWQLGACQ